jgi:hypothetical protein
MNVSPLHGNPPKWMPDQDHSENEANIQLLQFMMYNGENHVLATLNVDSGIQVGNILTSKVAAQTKSLNDVINTMPFIRELEVKSIAETAMRMDAEAYDGTSKPAFTFLPTVLKEIENQMQRANSAKEGYIVWLKPSQCPDHNWLRGSPEILPNPAKWESIMASTHISTSSLGSVIPIESMANGIIADAASSIRPSVSSESERKEKPKKTDDEKELDKAASSLLKLNTGAGEMVKAAVHMLNLGIDVEEGETSEITLQSHLTLLAVYSHRVKSNIITIAVRLARS